MDGDNAQKPPEEVGFRFMTVEGSSDLSMLGPDDQLQMGPDREGASMILVAAGAVLTRGGLPVIAPEVADGKHEMLDGTFVTKLFGEVIVRSDDLDGQVPAPEDLE